MPRRRKVVCRHSSTILDFGNRWRWLVAHAPAALPSRNRSRYPLDRRLCGPKNRSGWCGEKKNIALAGNQTPAVQPVARQYTDLAIPRNMFSPGMSLSRKRVNSVWGLRDEVPRHWIIPRISVFITSPTRKRETAGRHTNIRIRSPPFLHSAQTGFGGRSLSPG
jgi:hypothetical protein